MKKVYGVGINDADYQVVSSIKSFKNFSGNQVREWTCPFYQKWLQILHRSYSKFYKTKNPSYLDVTVCEEWLTFSNFKRWMEQQDWEGKELDKDLLVYGNKVYSPETCIFVPMKVNRFILESTKIREGMPIGVCFDKARNLFRAAVSIDGKTKFLGRFKTAEDAHNAWQKAKLALAEQLAAEQTDERISKALIERYKNYASLIVDIVEGI